MSKTCFPGCPIGRRCHSDHNSRKGPAQVGGYVIQKTNARGLSNGGWKVGSIRWSGGVIRDTKLAQGGH